MAKQPALTKTKDVFTHLWGVRFNDEEATMIEEEARAKDVKITVTQTIIET